MCSDYHYSANISKQLECQNNCLRDSACVGILYNDAYGHYCVVCKDDNLRNTDNGFGFYRKPGKSKRKLSLTTYYRFLGQVYL